MTIINGHPVYDYPTEWETEAGDVYGGSIDFVRGLLTVTKVCHSLDGTEGFSLYNSDRYVITLASLGWEENDETDLAASISSHFEYRTQISGGNSYGCFRISAEHQLIFGATDSPFADAAAFRMYLAAQDSAGTPVQVCYTLAEPITYRLTPQQIETFAGENRIWVVQTQGA